MTAAALLARLTGMGISVTAEGGRLRLRGEERAITPELLAEVQAHKPALLACLHPAAALGQALPPDDRIARLAMQPDGQEEEERLATEAEGNGEITPAQALQAVEEFDRLVQGHDWQDWRLEWLAELGGLMLHYRDADADARQQLLALADLSPGSAVEWLAHGATIRNALDGLRREGRLPPLRWPAR